MNVQELFQSIPTSKIVEADIWYCPPWESYANYTIEQKLLCVKTVRKKLTKLISTIKNKTNIPKTGKTVFVISQKSSDYENQNKTEYDTFIVNTEDAKRIIQEEGEAAELTKIKQFAYEFNELNEILGFEVAKSSIQDCGSLTVAVIILEEITFFGIEPDNRKERVEEVIEDLNQSVEKIEKGIAKTIPHEEVMESLYQRILDRCKNEDEREYIRLTHEYHEAISPIERRWMCEQLDIHAKKTGEMLLKEFRN